jgi:malonyl-CoA/methylmalonyl-CoA synthetase
MKSGGYKISALDVEREILGLPYISEVMVIGVEDEEFGERVAAAIVLKDKTGLKLDDLRKDLRGSLPGYQMPTVLRVVNEIPKNATGKTMKKQLRPQMFPPEGHADIQRWQRPEKRAAESRL